MSKLRCTECGFEFDANLQSCPECGNPASECVAVNGNQQQSNAAPTAATQVQAGNNVPPRSNDTMFKRDWAHYIYECGAMFWNSFTTKYAEFSGRATRREYWSFLLTSIFVTGTCPIAAIALIIPLLAVTARRLHDTNHSGWWMLVPWAGWFLQFKRSDDGVNEYGEPSIDIF